MSTPFPSRSPADGIVETHSGSRILRFERHLPHPIERVWAAITEPEQLIFSNTFPTSHTRLRESLAGWHVHLDFLAESLEGQAVDWPHWPLDRWARYYERYSQTIA